HSPARLTSAACAGSALIEGTRRNSASSSNQASVIERRSVVRREAGLRPASFTTAARRADSPAKNSSAHRARDSVPLSHVAQLLALREGAQLLQRLVLDLPDPLARDAERAADLVEGPRLLAVQAVAHLQHATLALGEHRQRA